MGYNPDLPICSSNCTQAHGGEHVLRLVPGVPGMTGEPGPNNWIFFKGDRFVEAHNEVARGVATVEIKTGRLWADHGRSHTNGRPPKPVVMRLYELAENDE